MEDYKAVAELSETIRDIHRKAFLQLLQERGVQVAEWNTEYITELTKDMEFHDVIPSVVEYSGDFKALPQPLLGSQLFRPLESGTADEYVDEHIYHMPSGFHAASIEAPLKHVRLRFNTAEKDESLHRSDDGHIFIGIDMPPLAIHEGDYEYINRLNVRNTGHGIGYGLAAIQAVESAFGEDAVEKVPATICRALRTVLLESNPHCAPD